MQITSNLARPTQALHIFQDQVHTEQMTVQITSCKQNHTHGYTEEILWLQRHFSSARKHCRNFSHVSNSITLRTKSSPLVAQPIFVRPLETKQQPLTAQRDCSIISWGSKMLCNDAISYFWKSIWLLGQILVTTHTIHQAEYGLQSGEEQKLRWEMTNHGNVRNQMKCHAIQKHG